MTTKAGSLERCLRVFAMLERAEVGKTTHEIARDLDVSVRTVQRYLIALERAGCIFSKVVHPHAAKGHPALRYRLLRIR
ncbi:MAG: helix-turn-helix domain-containing protein [Cyanobacteria bacterium REEB65]|nr:helix-turn-helix domain-containing protein [Cyanobacteria bacterium REEB65]